MFTRHTSPIAKFSSTTLALAALSLLAVGAGCGYHGGDMWYGDESYYPGDYVGGENLDPSSDQFREWDENDFISASEENTSTFSVDVNTASYTIMRRDLNNGNLPSPASVRVEEYINFFRFDYPEPVDDNPFSITMEAAPSYFGSDAESETERQLLRIGIKGKDVSIDEMKPSNLVFLVDVSGSMNPENRLPLAQKSLHIMLEYLRPTDTVGIQTYAGGTRTVLEPTPVAERAKIAQAIDALSSGGGTAGEAGIIAAYNMAESAKIEGGNNRVIIVTDGDFNVGRTGDALVELVQSYRDRHISLTAAGFGLGRFNDATMEGLARKGNGNYFYIDTIEEAQRIFGTHLTSTIEVIAADVKIQVEFNEDSVARYRLVGYEKRVMDNDDFRNDSADAGEIGPGHTVTALYELELHPEQSSPNNLLAEVRVRHKEQYGDESREQSTSVKLSQIAQTFNQASDDFRFAAAVAEFAEILRHSQHSEGARFFEVRDIAATSGATGDQWREEFLTLVETADNLWQ
ncbi:MAG: vWA domain-containing protein [Bradymonadaceae bacterium]